MDLLRAARLTNELTERRADLIRLFGEAAYLERATLAKERIREVMVLNHDDNALSAAIAFFYLGYSENRTYYFLCYVSAALAVLTKGPIGILLPGLACFLFLLYKKDLKEMMHVHLLSGLLLFTLIAGAVWANDAWGRYWGFDTKEVWTFVIWVLYAGYIHARATRGWRGSRSAWLSIIGFSAVMFNFTIVNMFFKGLHVYSGLS